MSRLAPLLLLLACRGVPGEPVGSSPAGDGLVLRRWSREVVVDGPALCTIVETASQWREVRERLGPAGAALADDWCAFAVERAVVVVVTGALALPVAETWHSEEGVDVVTLAPAVADPSRRCGIAHVMAVPIRPAQLAVVLRAPGADGAVVETTLGVFAGR